MGRMGSYDSIPDAHEVVDTSLWRLGRATNRRRSSPDEVEILSFPNATAEALMNPEVLRVPAEAPLVDLAQAFTNSGTDVAVAVDEDGRPVGVATAGAVLRLRHRAPRWLDCSTVAHASSIGVHAIRGEARTSQLLELFVVQGARHVVVVGDHGKVRGLIRSQDVLSWIARSHQ